MEHNTNDNSQMINPFHHRLINRPSARGWMVLCWMTLSWLVLLGLAVPAWAGPEQDTNPIDICSYDSKTLADLKVLIEARGLGKTLPELAQALSDDPDRVLAELEKNRLRINEDMHKKYGIPIGRIHLHRVFCPQGSGNQNMWFFDVLENETGIIERVNTQLFYNDQNFVLRDEKINAARYLPEEGVVSAVASLMETHSYSREQIRQEMIAGGFWLNRSCKTAQTVTDTFVAPPFPPNSVFYVMGLQSSASAPAHAAIAFSRPGEEFLNVKPFFGEDSSSCDYNKWIYSRQSAAFFEENYPESPWTKAARKGRAQRQLRNTIKDNVEFLKSFAPTGDRPDPALIDFCEYNVESFDDLNALVQARGLGTTLPELAAMLSDDPISVLTDWEEYNQPLDQELQELSGVATGRLYKRGWGCLQESGFYDVWWFRIIKNEDDRVAWIETTLLYNDDQNHTKPDQTGHPEPDRQIPSSTGDAIDLCSYDVQSLDDLTALVQARGLRRTLPELAGLLSDDPAAVLAYWNANNQPVDQGMQQMTSITAGRIYRFVRSCQQEFDNQNIWSFHILENEAGRVEIIDPYLFYDYDQNFVMRREAINAQRYATPEGLIRAMTSMMKTGSYSREQLREEMIAGGFWLNDSCEDSKILGDVFIAPVAPPDSLIGLHGYSWPIYMHPHVGAMFSRSSGEWIKAQMFVDIPQPGCRFDGETMQQRIRVFFKENYPDSWAASKYGQTPVMKNQPKSQK